MTGVLLGSYSYAEFFGTSLAFLPALGVSHLRHRHDPTQRMPGRWMRRFGRTTSRLTPVWQFSVDGTPPPDIMKNAYVVIANHESTADPFLLSWLPWDMRWIAKAELFRLPLIGALMRFGGDIPLERGVRDSVERMLAECRRTLDAGMPIMMFPEGTRSPDGRMLPFKNGAFQLALEAQVPVLPVALAGTRNCRPKGSSWFGQARAHARVLEPITTRGLGVGDVDLLRDLARRRIAEALPAVRELVGVPPGELDSLEPSAVALHMPVPRQAQHTASHAA